MRVSSGRDFQSNVMGNTASTGTGTYAAANYVALTENSTAPADGDTTLASELASVGGGLSRKQGTYGHVAGSSAYTITVTFTANVLDTPPRTPAKMGVFNAVTAGTLVFESAIPSPTAMNSGDSLTITDTVSISC